MFTYFPHQQTSCSFMNLVISKKQNNSRAWTQLIVSGLSLWNMISLLLLRLSEVVESFTLSNLRPRDWTFPQFIICNLSSSKADLFIHKSSARWRSEQIITNWMNQCTVPSSSCYTKSNGSFATTHASLGNSLGLLLFQNDGRHQ